MKPAWMRNALVGLAALGLAACGGSGQEKAPAPEKAPPTAQEQPVQQAKAPPKLDLATLQDEATFVALTPSPVEMQAALKKAGIAQSLSKLVKKRDIQTAVTNKDQAAVRVGVVLADLVLTARDGEKQDILHRLQRVGEGMEVLGAGQDLQKTLHEYEDLIKNDAISRDRLVQEMDELSGAVFPELEYEAGPQVVPLIQAGIWLEGANLVANAIRLTGQYEAADQLLKQPEVVDYFLKYVKTEGTDRAPDQVVSKLEQVLTKLLEITRKDHLDEEDVKTIHVETDSVLALL